MNQATPSFSVVRERTDPRSRPSWRVRCSAARILLVLFLAASGSSVGPRPITAQEPPHDEPAGASSNRERWDKLSPEERDRLEQLARRLRDLPPEKREQLLSRLRELSTDERRERVRRARERLGEPPEDRTERAHRERLIRRMWRRLTPEERQILAKLPADERQRRLLARVEDQRERVIRRLPEDLQPKVRTLEPRRQARFLRQWLSVDGARRTFTDPDEVRRLRALPRRRVVQRLLPPPTEASGLRTPPGGKSPAPGREPDAERDEPDDALAEARRPSFLAKETWQRWRALRPFERPPILRRVLDAGTWPPPFPDPERFRAREERERRSLAPSRSSGAPPVPRPAERDGAE